MRMERVKQCAALSRIRVCALQPTSRDSQPPVTPALGDLMPLIKEVAILRTQVFP